MGTGWVTVLIYTLMAIGVWTLPGIVIGTSRMCQKVLGYSNDRLFGNLELPTMGLVPLVIFGIGFSYLGYGILFFEYFFDFYDALFSILLHGLAISTGLVHIGLIRRGARAKYRFLEIAGALGGAGIGALIGIEEELVEGVLFGVFLAIVGFLIGRTTGWYAGTFSKTRSGFWANIRLSGIVGGLAGGIAGGIFGGLAGGLGVDNTNEIFDLGVFSLVFGILAGGFLGGLFGGLARPATPDNTNKTGAGKHHIFSRLSLLLFIIEIVATLTTMHFYGESITLFWILPGILIGTLAGGAAGALSGGIAGGVVTGVTRAVLVTTRIIAECVTSVMTPLLISYRFRPSICEHCFGSTLPLNSQYEDGKRFCEHCRKEVERAQTSGKVVLTFGKFPVNTEGRVFLFSNPDFERIARPIEVSEVYLDTTTTDVRLFERFITYLLNYPPRLGVQSVKVFYRGPLEYLGENLKNGIQHLFPRLKALPLSPLQTQAHPAACQKPEWFLSKFFDLMGRKIQQSLPDSLTSCRHPVLILLHQREVFWEQVKTSQALSRLILAVIPFILFSCAIYGAVLAGWRSPALSVYVAIKLPLLLLGTTGIVAILNWMLASAFGSGMTFQQVTAVTYGAMTVSSWILLGLAPVTLFFTMFVSSATGSHAEIQRTHNCLLLMHIALIAIAGIAGNNALRKGLQRLVSPGCAIRKLYWSWVCAFALVGCQLSWILRPFVGSPFYPVVFMRPDCLQRNFYEFIFLEVIPYIINGG